MRGNHKGLSVERYRRFLNKTQAIAGEEKGTRFLFTENYKTSQCAWNSDTDMSRSVAAVGCHFKFPMDIKFSGSLTLNSPDQSSVYSYLRDVSNDSIFATSILQALIDERKKIIVTCGTKIILVHHLKLGTL